MQGNICTVFIWVSCAENDYYHVVSTRQLSFDCCIYHGCSCHMQGRLRKQQVIPYSSPTFAIGPPTLYNYHHHCSQYREQEVVPYRKATFANHLHPITTSITPNARLFTALYCLVFFIWWLSGQTELWENWTPAKHGRLDWVSVSFVCIVREAVNILKWEVQEIDILDSWNIIIVTEETCPRASKFGFEYYWFF